MAARRSALERLVLAGLTVLAGGCSTSDPVTVEGDVAIAYVKRPVATLGNPTDSVRFARGGDLYLREKSSPSAPETNITGSYTQGQGDVSDPEVSYDGKKILFSMRGPNDATWDIWEYDIPGKSLRRINDDNALNPFDRGNDVDPAYLPDGRIVFVSDRQQKSRQALNYKYLDEYERETVTTLHVMNNDGSDIRQISFNQSHDRNPTVLSTGEIMYSRWDHVGGRNQLSIFFTNPDGTNLFVLYGAHSPGNSYLHPREMQDGRVISSLMPLSGTREGGALMVIDIKNYSENTEPAPGVPGGGQGQHQPTAQPINFGRGVSEFGRYSTPYPLWDGTNRVLVAYTPSRPVDVANPITGALEQEEDTPVYGVYMFNTNDQTLRPVVLAPDGYAVLDPVAIQSRPVPNTISDKTLDAGLAARDVGILNVKSVYDTDSQGRMGDAVLVSGECIPRVGVVDRCAGNAGATPDIVRLKNPADTGAAERPARFVRVTQAVPTQSGISREAIGETDFEMQRILGYAEVEPDGSFKVEVPADTPIAIAVLDKDGRAFTPHTNWIQVRPGETRTCNGCHSRRRGNAINAAPIAGNHPNTRLYGDAANLAASGESMAETRTRVDASAVTLKSHIAYADVWTNANLRAPDASLTIDYSGLTAAPSNGIIDYPTHIQPLWTKDRGANTCTGCHNNNNPDDPVSHGLDLRDAVSGTGRLLSYEELMVGDPILDENGLPIIDIVEDELRVRRDPALVQEAGSRGSHLVEVLFNQELRASQTLADATSRTDHSTMLNASEKRVVTEWVDLGGQYYNSPRDGSNNLRGVSGLDEDVFTATIHMILLDRCGACHRAVGPTGTATGTFEGQRFVLTGQAEGDFNVTASMVNNVTDPAASYLLARPASNSVAPNPVHPQIGEPPSPVLSGGPDYDTIYSWINAAGP